MISLSFSLICCYSKYPHTDTSFIICRTSTKYSLIYIYTIALVKLLLLRIHSNHCVPCNLNKQSSIWNINKLNRFFLMLFFNSDLSSSSSSSHFVIMQLRWFRIWYKTHTTNEWWCWQQQWISYESYNFLWIGMEVLFNNCPQNSRSVLFSLIKYINSITYWERGLIPVLFWNESLKIGLAVFTVVYSMFGYLSFLSGMGTHNASPKQFSLTKIIGGVSLSYCWYDWLYLNYVFTHLNIACY